MERQSESNERERGQLQAELADEREALLAALPSSAFAIPADAWWVTTRKLADVVADWRGHDTQHAEDVRLALEDGTDGAD